MTPMTDHLLQRLSRVRRQTECLTAPLTPEDMAAQSMAEASPAKWHLAHTSWFFTTFLPLDPVRPPWAELYNSYYRSLGEPFRRSRRGLVTRPGVAEVMAWRQRVTAAAGDLLAGPAGERLAPLAALGIAHEEQHQELILSDLLHLFSCNPLAPTYDPAPPAAATTPATLSWIDHRGGLHQIGCSDDGFAFDNERPRHAVHLAPWRLASRLATNGDYLDFIADGGYRRPEFWLSDGWDLALAEGWQAPLYWRRRDGGWETMSLAGLHDIDPKAPVSHVSYYEADAFAAWSGKRLPTESEWEAAALDPAPGLEQMFGCLWQWTASAYLPYPGYRPPIGALGEYNGKFMINQMILRGGSFATAAGHSRPSYRNFFPPAARWQFSGIRLAETA